MPDFKRYYNDPAYPTTVSRDVPPGEYSWDTVVYQSGRPVLDAELNLTQDAAEYAKLLIAGKTLPSGFLRSQSSRDSFADFGFFGATPGNENVFSLNKQLAFVAGMPVVVEYTDTSTANLNLINLPVPSNSWGVSPDIKRTDFVFLEVWRTLVAPSPRAFGTIEITETGAPPAQTIQAGDTVTVDTTAVGGPLVTFTAVLVPAFPTQFAIGVSGASTASALAACINSLLSAYVAANTFGTNTVTISAVTGGTAGNGILLSYTEAVPNSIVRSGPAFTGGANRPNKPSQSQVYRHGNVDSDPATWLPDELVDPVINAESAQRVQVQYRLRVFALPPSSGGVNPKTEPNGFSVGIEAQGPLGAPVAGYPFVPANNSTVSGSSDATAYGFVDNGLWLAGDGSNAAAIALGTVDGFVYAIPLCFVFRRNDASGTGGFDPDNTVNSGLPVAHAAPFNNTHLDPAFGPVAIAALKSDRPDGLFADIIVPTDLLDLRRHVTPPGYDFGSELKYQLQSLLDKKTATWQVDGSDWAYIGNGSGDQSTFPLFCDQVGRFPAPPPPAPRGNLIRQYDHVARRFASQSVVERVVFEIYPNAVPPPGITIVKLAGAVNWYEGDQVFIDFDSLNPTTLQDWSTPAIVAAQLSAYWPTGTRVTDVISAYHDDGISTALPVDQSVQLSAVAGVGTNLVAITLDANTLTVNGGGTTPNHPMVGDSVSGDVGSGRRIFIEFEITYPTGAGLTQTPDIIPTPSAASGYAPYAGGPTIEDDPNQRPPEMAPTWYPQPKFRSGFREVRLEQKSAPGGFEVADNLVTVNATTLRTPRRFFALPFLTANGAPAASATYGSSARTITLSVPVLNQKQVTVKYFPQDPVPSAGAVGYSTSVYYRTQAPQTAGVSGLIPTTLMPATLVVEPVAISPEVWTGQTGKGSTDLGYPYESPLDPIPVATGVSPAPLPKEWYFSALADVTVADFSAATGLLSLHSFVQVDGTNPVQLGGPGRGPLKDPELRLYFDLANPNGYKPTAMAQPLFGATRHKTFQPMLVRSTVDTLLFRKGELLLLILSQFHELSADNKIVFSDNPAIRTSAAIYRTRNLLLTVGD